MAIVDVVVVAEKGAPYCASCGGGRTLEDITHSLKRQLGQSFGDAVSCKFVDVREYQQAGGFTDARSQDVRLPLVLIGGKVRYRGLFSPTFIRRDVRELLERSGHSVSRDQARERSMRQWLYHAGSNWGTDRRPANR